MPRPSTRRPMRIIARFLYWVVDVVWNLAEAADGYRLR